jgi:hypothetical protein
MIGTQYHNGVPYHPSTPKKVWRKIRKTLLIDSRDRQITPDAHPGSYTITMPTVYQNIYAASLRSIELPLSFYTFSACAKNTSMSVSYGGVVNATVQIPDGNYNLIDGTFTTAIKSALNAAIPGNTFVVEYSAVTNKITFRAAATFSLNFTKSLPADTSCGAALAFPFSTCWGLGYYMGFQQTTRTAVSSDGTYILTSDFAANADPTTYILMEIANLNKNDESSIDNRRSGTIDGSFAKIPLDGNSGDYVFLTDTGSYPLNRHVYQPPVSKINTLQIKFRYHDGRVVDFNGTEHSFTLELELLDNNFDEFSSMEFGM